MSAGLFRIPPRGAPLSIGERSLQASGETGTLANPPQWLYEALAAGLPSSAGVIVTPETAMRCGAVYACIRVLSESIAQIPIAVYKKLPNGESEEDPSHPLYPVLHDDPNDWQTSYEWREMAMGHANLRGNYYAFIGRIGQRVVNLLPIHPDRVAEVQQQPDWTVVYKIRMADGALKEFTTKDVLHLSALSLNGITGVTPIAHAREAIGLALAAEAHGARVFGNGARLGGVLTHPNKLSDEAAKRLKESWQAAFTGANQHKTAVLEEGMKWEQLGMTSEDAQFLETRKYQRAEISALFRVPLHMIGDLERATFSNIEHQSIEFVVHTMMPWVVRWEQRLSKQLLSKADRRTHEVRFKVDGLLRGDTATRFAAYAVAITNGWMNRNEVRRIEGLKSAPGLDEYLTPLNMLPVGAGKATKADGSPADALPDTTQ